MTFSLRWAFLIASLFLIVAVWKLDADVNGNRPIGYGNRYVVCLTAPRNVRHAGICTDHRVLAQGRHYHLPAYPP